MSQFYTVHRKHIQANNILWISARWRRGRPSTEKAENRTLPNHQPMHAR